jgi:hypothetical protein
VGVSFLALAIVVALFCGLVGFFSWVARGVFDD